MELVDYQQSPIPTFFNCNILPKPVLSTQQPWTPPPWKNIFIQQKLNQYKNMSEKVERYSNINLINSLSIVN